MKTSERVLELLTRSETYLSGQELADRLQLTRAAIWKAIKQLKEAGYQIDSKPHVGYRYTDSDTLNQTAILQALSSDLDLDLQVFDSLPSTNLKAKELGLNTTLQTPLVVIADHQTAGYGRYQRDFISPKNTGIYLSILLANKSADFDPGLLTTATAIAVTRTLEKTLALKPTIKWVNDVLVDDKKICGILTEGIADLETQSLSQVVVGTGINFLTEISTFPPELQARVGTLAPYVKKNRLSRNRFIAIYLNEFFKIYQNYTTGSFMDEYRAHCELIGKHVTIQRPTGTLEAQVIDINDHGALVLKNGQVLNSGEVIKVRKV
ncbi:biotin--[acetyl-CoA-carboxylase] ligase [Ligilactobacillus murinus]|uniref:biotin--[acetyl-CoA-carboxylase] ligase n=1 Tax=Ligilactobacillus murinus TaxID=1622 RepID=UPI00296ACFDF|nr:biotin--[acetyl-CoA-carboxylase] ligase [Ligilactobacillus murinus]WOY88705.1 biotin--[acetyl-CoA-carboxylase] ligase [Ligilactobacillus murinus]